MREVSFILIDDDPISNLICQVTIEKYFGARDIKTFLNAEEGLQYIKSNFKDAAPHTTNLLLDINMPVMTGWEFLESFHHLDDTIKGSINIYILSSSVDPRDKERSGSNKYVKQHLIKPLSGDSLKQLIAALES